MISHPDTMYAMTDLHRLDLLTTAARERRAATVTDPVSLWHPLVIRTLALSALARSTGARISRLTGRPKSSLLQVGRQ